MGIAHRPSRSQAGAWERTSSEIAFTAGCRSRRSTEIAWNAVRAASGSVPEGSARVYRVLFDRERHFAGKREREVPPLRPAPPVDAGTFPVTTVTAVPSAFREEYRIEQVPVLFLLDREGRVAGRWSGAFPALADEIAREINRLLAADRPPEM